MCGNVRTATPLLGQSLGDPGRVLGQVEVGVPVEHESHDRIRLYVIDASRAM